jgi:transcriptional regulator with XRE-family HTH domain
LTNANQYVYNIYIMKNLLRAIQEYQDRNKLNDSRFAQLVGIDQSTLSKIKAGHRKPGTRVLAAFSHIPELKGYCYIFLADRKPNTPHSPHNGQQGGLFGKLVSIIKRIGR